MFEISEPRRTLEREREREREREIGLPATNYASRVYRNLFYKTFSIILIVSIVLPQIAGAVTIDNRGTLGEIAGGVYSYEIPGTEGMSEMEVISTLKRDIQILEEEIATCNRKRKGWTAATVVGGVGVVGTGIAALVQNSNRKEKKAEIEKVNTQIGNTEQQISSMKQ